MDKRISVAEPGTRVPIHDFLNDSPESLPGLADWIIQGRAVYWVDDFDRLVDANDGERGTLLACLSTHQRMIEGKLRPHQLRGSDVREYWFNWQELGEPSTWGHPFLRASLDENARRSILTCEEDRKIDQDLPKSVEMRLYRQIGALALALAQSGGNKFKWGDKINHKQLAEFAISAAAQVPSKSASKRGVNLTDLRQSIKRGIEAMTTPNLSDDI